MCIRDSLLTIRAKITVPAAVPPAKTMIPIPNPTHDPPNTAFTMILPVSTCQVSVKSKKIDITIELNTYYVCLSIYSQL